MALTETKKKRATQVDESFIILMDLRQADWMSNNYISAKSQGMDSEQNLATVIQKNSSLVINILFVIAQTIFASSYWLYPLTNSKKTFKGSV